MLEVLYPFAFKLQGVIPNGALILNGGLDYIINIYSHLKATVGIYHFLQNQSGVV